MTTKSNLTAEIERLKELDAKRTQGEIDCTAGGELTLDGVGMFVCFDKIEDAAYFSNTPKMMQIILRLQQAVSAARSGLMEYAGDRFWFQTDDGEIARETLAELDKIMNGDKEEV